MLPGTSELFGRLHEAPAFRDRCDLVMRWLERSIRMNHLRSAVVLAALLPELGTLTRVARSPCAEAKARTRCCRYPARG